jgi:YD repeat-containing protein
MSRLWCAVFLLLCVYTVYAQQQFPALERGFHPEKQYQFNDVDSVSILNRNLTIHIPIGMNYPLNGGLSYQLMLTYNSNVWDLQSIPSLGVVRATPTKRSNAGLGWLLSLGRFVSHLDTVNNQTGADIFESSDGADHPFWSSPPGCSPPCADTMTSDSSDIRERIIDESNLEIDSPDGTVRHFLREQDGITWDLTKITGPRRTDSLTITYNTVGSSTPSPAQCVAGTTKFQTLSDSRGRTHYICIGSGGIRRVSLASFGAQRANYDFEYYVDGATQELEPALEDNDYNDTSWPRKTFASLLKSVSQPDGSTWQMLHPVVGVDGNRDIYSNRIATLTLPTKGAISYGFGVIYIPSTDPCANTYGLNYGFGSTTVGIGTRTLKPVGGVDETWIYSDSLSSAILAVTDCEQPLSPINIRPAPPYDPGSVHPLLYEKMTVTVQRPSGDFVRHYFSVWPGDGDRYTSPAGFKRSHHGLPYGPYDSNRDLYLSQEVFPAGATSPSRSVYVRHIPELDAGSDPPQSTRLVAQRTVYRDDPPPAPPPNHPGDPVVPCTPDGSTPTCRYKEIDYSDSDAYSHFRTSLETGNVGGSDVSRTVTTSYNKNSDGTDRLIAASEKWILDVYDDIQTTQSGTTLKEQYCIDKTNGFMSGKRVLAASNPGPTDLLSVFGIGTDGNLAFEKYYGGDTQSLPDASRLCDALATDAYMNLTPTYRVDHEWQNGVMSKSNYGSTLTTLDLTVDLSGLPSSSRDTASQQTTYSFDASGRIVSVTPPGVAATTYTYTAASAASTVLTPATVVASTTATESDAGAIKLEYQYDSFGRLWREKKSLPSATLLRETLYDANWRKSSVSEWEKITTADEFAFFPTHKTSFGGYDSFDRAHQITAPDGKVTHFDYTGDSVRQRTVRIGHDQGAGTVTEVDSITAETYDALGRLRKVVEPSNGDVCNDPVGDESHCVATTYTYDAGDRLHTASTTAGGVTQPRTWGYDSRGLLLSDLEPERNVSYDKYDARGHATSQITGSSGGSFDLLLTYDSAERLTDVDEINPNGTIPTERRKVKQFIFSTANSGTNLSAGKLSQAVRYNYLPQAGTHTVTEDYFYGGLGGRLSKRDTTIKHDITTLRVFTEGFSYNSTGDTASITYPVCVPASNCTIASPLAGIKLGYKNGFPERISNDATNGATYGVLSYADNGALQTVDHGVPTGQTAHVTDTYEIDPNFIQRPHSITFDGFLDCSPPAAPTLTVPTAICAGASGTASVTSVADVIYTWTVSGGSLTSSNTGTSITFSAGTSGNVAITVTASLCGTASATRSVAISQAPHATVTSSSAVVDSGVSVQLTATLTGTPNWSVTWSDGFTQTNITTTAISRTVNPTSTITYSITDVSDASSCPGSASGSTRFTVRPPAPASISAMTEASNNLAVDVSWTSVAGAASYVLEKAPTKDGPWSSIGSFTTTSTSVLFNPTVLPVTYVFRVSAVDGSSVPSNPSPLDYATIATQLFHDDPISSGITTLKGVHISELRRAVDAVRYAAGRPPYSAGWTTDYTAPTGTVLAQHIIDLRNALNEAANDILHHNLTFSGPPVAAHEKILGAHVQQLRVGVE